MDDQNSLYDISGNFKEYLVGYNTSKIFKSLVPMAILIMLLDIYFALIHVLVLYQVSHCPYLDGPSMGITLKKCILDVAAMLLPSAILLYTLYSDITKARNESILITENGIVRKFQDRPSELITWSDVKAIRYKSFQNYPNIYIDYENGRLCLKSFLLFDWKKTIELIRTLAHLDAEYQNWVWTKFYRQT